MKKLFLSIAVFSMMSLSAFAANNNDNNNGSCKAKTECMAKGKGECKKDGKKDKEGRADRMMKAFENLNLTDAQKTKLQSLMAEQKAKKESFREKKSERKENKENLTAEQPQQKRAEMMASRKQSKQDFLNGVKSILTPEQYTMFLENSFNAGDRHGKGMKQGHKGHKDMKAHNTDRKMSRNGEKGQNTRAKAQKG